MSEAARKRIARVEAKRPRDLGVVRAASGTDRTAELVDYLVRLLDTEPPKAQG